MTFTDLGKVLVVDDEPFNRELLYDLLEAAGHQVVEATNGREALEGVTRHQPDVVLLDVMMPPPNGFEVCRQLKATEETAPIPILLVTALTDRASRLKGIEAGANDFLSKPIDTAETALRVKNAVRLKKLYDLSEQRYRKQVELEQLKESLIHMIVHDLKTPLTSITGYSRFLEKMACDRLNDQEKTYLQRSISNGDRLLEMIASVLDVTRLESGCLKPNLETVLVADLFQDALTVLKALARPEVSLEVSCPDSLHWTLDPDLLRRVLINLGDNALRHLPQDGGRVELKAQPVKDRLRFEVEDTGRGIPAESQQRIFEKFGQLEGGHKHTFGLGLAFCKLAVEAHQGEIGVTSSPGQGATFWFDLAAHPH